MNKTFYDMQNNVANEVQDTSVAFKSIIKAYLNNRYFQVLRSVNWDGVRTDYTFDTVAGTQEYVLPDDFGKPLIIRDTTNGKEIYESDLQKLASDNPSTFNSQGTVDNYYISEDTVMAQPSSASTISIVSSSASDTTVIVQVRGISSSVETSEEVTLTGTTAAVTTNSYTRITGISKSSVSVGKVTLTSNSGAVTIAVLAPQVTVPYYKKMGFFYVPSTVLTVASPYIIKPLPLVNDYDYPIIDIADLVENGAKADAWRYKRQFSKASVFEVMFSSGIMDYVWDRENKPNKVTQFFPSTYNKDNLY